MPKEPAKFSEFAKQEPITFSEFAKKNFPVMAGGEFFEAHLDFTIRGLESSVRTVKPYSPLYEMFDRHSPSFIFHYAGRIPDEELKILMERNAILPHLHTPLRLFMNAIEDKIQNTEEIALRYIGAVYKEGLVFRVVFAKEDKGVLTIEEYDTG